MAANKQAILRTLRTIRPHKLNSLLSVTAHMQFWESSRNFNFAYLYQTRVVVSHVPGGVGQRHVQCIFAASAIFSP